MPDFSLNPIDILNNGVNSVGNSVRDLFGLGATKSNADRKAQFSLDDFKGEVLGKGLAQENRFEVFIGIPPCISSYRSQMQGSLIRVESVQFPALQLFTKQRKTYGPGQNVPIAMDYGGEQGVTVVFLLDRDMNTKKMFDAWMGCIVDLDSQTVAYPETYKTLLGIHQLDKTDGSVYEAIIQDCYPRVVSSMTGNMSAQGFQRVAVTFSYRKWSCKQVEAQKLSVSSAAASLVSKGGDAVKSVSDQINQRAANLQGIASKYGLTTSISGISL